ncbi:MAG TPA: hypothetical protein VFW31_09535 [Candidatus Angelobacter sp.]|nr:hypothetical protein [Candidatus Angelobacter sp.]
MKPLREAFVLVLRTPRLWAVQFLGNAVILLLYAGWLRLPEAHWWDLLLNFVVLLLAIVGALALHGGTLNYFPSAHADRAALLTPNFKQALRHCFAIAIWAVVFFFLCFQADRLGDYAYTFPGYLRAELPSWLRKHTTADGFTSLYGFMVGFIVWVVLPGLLLPGALLAANQGFRGLIRLRAWGRVLRRVSYWVVLVLAVVPAGIVVMLLLDWKMNADTATLRGEEISLVLRLLACYVIALFAWLCVCSMVGRVFQGDAHKLENQGA